MKDSNENKGGNSQRDYAFLLIPSGLFIGLGIGYIFDQLIGWTFLGLGFGFMLMVFARMNQ